MNAARWRIAPGASPRLKEFDPDDTGSFATREDAVEATAADLARLDDLQERLFVDGRHALLLVLQGMDTAGKDGMIRHLSAGLDLLGAEVHSFKAPTAQELAHDYLWRVHQVAPARGRIGIFNRSHYEDVLVVRVHNLVPEEMWKRRYEQINEFEQLLAENGTVIVKCFLHISKREQKERLQARLDEPDKRWKFNPGDLKERALWDEYTEAYETALEKCSTDAAPWYVIPADKKWFRNYAVTRVLVETLESLDLRLPKLDYDPATITIPD